MRGFNETISSGSVPTFRLVLATPVGSPRRRAARVRPDRRFPTGSNSPNRRLSGTAHIMRIAERTDGRLNPRSVSEAKLTDSNQTCFDWQSRLRAFTEPGLSSCVADGRLTLDGRRVAATVIDLYALRLVEWALARRQSIIICPPEPFGPLRSLAAAAAHIASITQHYERTGQARGSDQRVAVVTSSARLRGIYRRLGIGTAPLFDVAPAAIRSGPGRSRFSVGTRLVAGRRFLFRLRPTGGLANVDMKVIELPLGDGSRARPAGRPAHPDRPRPRRPLVVRLARDIPVFAWTDDDLGMLPSCDRRRARPRRGSPSDSNAPPQAFFVRRCRCKLNAYARTRPFSGRT